MINTPLQHEFIHTNGIRLHVVLAGPLDGLPLILLHGFPEFWYGWRHQIDPLAQAGFRVIVPDQRGYNLSDKPAQVSDYQLERLAGDVTGLMTALGYERVCLAGHDWGAAVTWQVASTTPQFLHKFAILNVPHPAVMTRTLRRSLRQLLKSWYIFFFQWRWLSERLLSRQDYSGLLAMLQASAQPGTFSPQELQAYRQAYQQPGALSGMLNWYRAAFRAGVRPAAHGLVAAPPAIQVPALILWGARDAALSREMAGLSADLCAHSQLVFYENATHWVQHDEAEDVTRRLIEFFKPGA